MAVIEDYLTTLAAAGQPATTIQLRRSQLGRMARELSEPTDVTLNEVPGEQLIAWLGSHADWSRGYRRGFRAACRGFFVWAYRTGRIPVHIADEKLPKARQAKAFARPAPDQVWQQAIAAADARQLLMLRLAGECGLRRAEIAKVHRRDLTDGVAGWQLVVHGKGDKPRVIPVGDALAEAICTASGDGWLFPSRLGGHLTPARVAQVAQRVLPDGWTVHTLRQRFATRAYRGSRNLRAVQTLLGHSSIATTERYLQVDDGEVRAAMLAAL